MKPIVTSLDVYNKLSELFDFPKNTISFTVVCDLNELAVLQVDVHVEKKLDD